MENELYISSEKVSKLMGKKFGLIPVCLGKQG